MDSLSRRDPS
ncbi:hypothetical protein SLEP1_g60525, partial [Rubroshorea leprosula]